MSIGDVSRLSGVPASTLRYYEDIELVPSPPRISGRRRYDASVLDRLVVITVSRRAGLTLAEVGELLDGMTADATPSIAWRSMAARKLPEIDALIRRLQAMRLVLQGVATCQCSNLAECAASLRGCDPAQNGSRSDDNAGLRRRT